MQSNVNRNVFFSSALFIFFITLLGSIWPDTLKIFFSAIQSWLITKASWIYILAVGFVLFFALYLMVSRFGDIKLGPDHSEPEYKSIPWFTMLFSAGMGIGLLFFGVAEPLMHFASPPVGDAATIASARGHEDYIFSLGTPCLEYLRNSSSDLSLFLLS